MYDDALDKYWKTVVNTLQDGIMIVNKRGSIVSGNAALEKITGFSRQELVGKSCSVLNCDIYEYARKNAEGHWCVLFKTGSMKKKKCTILRKDGTRIHVLKNAALLQDGSGKVIGAVESITDITEIIKKDSQIAEFRRELKSEDGFYGLLGTSFPMQQIFSLINNAAQSDAPVIIFGESGTGKDLVAKSIHTISKRKRKPFIKVNCAALTESLLESELFGHVKGAYTGAYKNREGRFESAHKGDIFLDEIGDLPLSTQVKLLRVLEDKVVERVGDNNPIPVDVRIISATNKKLSELIDKGAFREDLFFRINVIPINVPPLRERISDIPILADSFFQRIKLKTGKEIKGISNEAMEYLLKYSWPGNVRELKSAFEYAFVTCHEPMIEPEHLPQNIFHSQSPTEPVDVANNDRDERVKKELLEALYRAGGNQSRAASILGVSRVTVWNRMNKYHIKFNRKIELQ